MTDKILDNRYEVLETIGSGLWGEVYKVLDLFNKEKKALKVVAKRDQGSNDRLKDEFRRLVKLKHPHIVRVYDLGFEAKDVAYYTMEFCNGGDLSAIAAPLTEHFILHIASQLCTALQFIHSRGLVHGDIKPQNILLPDKLDITHPEEGVFKFSDISIYRENICRKRLQHRSLARISINGGETIGDRPMPVLDVPRETKGTVSPSYVLTLPYASPEAVLNEEADYRTDLYSLGVVLYLLATGVLPFTEENTADLITAILRKPPVVPQKINANISENLNHIILRLLEKEPLHRYQSARELLNDIANIPQSPGKDFLATLSDCAVIGNKFVGRESEVATGKELLEEVIEGNGQALFLYGEAGIGKSSLAFEMKLIAQLQGCSVAWSACDKTSLSSFHPIREILSQLGFFTIIDSMSLSAMQRERLKHFMTIGSGEETDIEKAVSAVEVISRPEIQILFEALISFIELKTEYFQAQRTEENAAINEGIAQPLFLVIENCHEGDSFFISFLEYLIRNIVNLPIFLCCTYRDDELFSDEQGKLHPLLQLQKLSDGLSHFNTIRLRRFAMEDTARVIKSFLEISAQPAGFVRQIHEITSGNPFFVNELLRYLLEHNILSFEQGNWWIADQDSFLKMPSKLRDIIKSRYGRLTELQKSILQKAAILPRKFLLPQLAEFTGKDPLILSDIVDDLVTWKLLKRRRLGNSLIFSFHHNLYRYFIYETNKPEGRAALHAQAANIIEESFHEGASDMAAYLAFNFHAGKLYDKAIRYARIAANQAKELTHHSEAARYIEMIANLLPGQKSSLSLPLILEELGDAYFDSQQYDKSQATYERIVSVAGKPVELTDLIRLERKKGRLYERKGDLKTAKDVYIKAMEQIPAHVQLPEALHLMNQLGWVYCKLKDYKEASALCRRALREARELQNAEFIAYTYTTLGRITEDSDDPKRAQNYYSRALTIYNETKNTVGMYTIYNNLGNVSMNIGDWDRSIEFHQKSLEMKQKSGDLHSQAVSLSNLAMVYSMQGEWKKAFIYFQNAYDIFKRLGNREMQATLKQNLGALYLRKGDFNEAHKSFNEALLIREDLNDAAGMGNTLLSLSQLALRQEEFEAARDYLNRSQMIFKKLDLKKYLAVTYRIAAELYHRQNNFSLALREIHRAEKTAVQFSDPIELGTIFRIFGEISRDMGDKQKSREYFEKSIDTLTEAKADFELGQTLLILGKNSLESNLLGEAGEYLEKAKTIFSLLKTRDFLEETATLQNELQAKLQPYYFSLPSDREQLQALIRISQLINSIKELDRLLEEVLDNIIKAVAAERGAIYLIDESSRRFVPHLIRNLEEQTVTDASQISKTIAESVALRGEPVYITDTKQDSLCAHSKSIELYGIVSILCVPLKLHDKLLGVVYLDSRSIADIFLERDLQFIAAFANIASLAIDNLIEKNRLKQENVTYKLQSKELFEEQHIIARSKAMQAVLNTVSKVASSTSTVLIGGESGTGKELIARAIHRIGVRKDQTFFPFFCGNVPESIIDSELFGYVKGAFTGADSNRKGIFEEAHGGTVLLDEISEIGPNMQAKLLRFLQEREIKPVGASFIKKVDVRIVAATNKNLLDEVKKGRFREDLYYRLNVIAIRLPSLKERREDIPLLAHHFMMKYSELLNKKVKGITRKAMDRLLDYSWPGNVRELENQIELAVNLVEDNSYIDESFLRDEVRSLENVIRGVNLSGTLKEILARIEREIIVKAILQSKGNKSKAARKLGITRQNLNQKMKNLDIY